MGAKHLILLALMIISFKTSAQNNKKVLESIGVVFSSCNGMSGEWCMSQGTAAVGFPPTLLGYKAMLDEWLVIKPMLDLTYGEGIEVNRDVHECSSCGLDMMDYRLWHPALQAGTAWALFIHEYPNAGVKLFFNATDEGYMIALLNMR